jgi:signal transduction histidine kinase
MTISALLIYFVSRSIIRKQYQLQQQLNNERISYKNQLAMEVFNAQEEERKKIGEELHDNINQLLGVVKLYIEHAQMNPAARDEMLVKSSEFIKQVINEIRTLSKALVSPTLSDIGLVESINELVDAIIKIKNIEIQVNKNTFSEETLNATQKLMIYRITQEQLNNILKHSKAEHVDIELIQQDGYMKLIIVDDGIGFDKSKSTQGLGLKNIKHRLELFNGSMNLETAPQEGCRLEAVFQL